MDWPEKQEFTEKINRRDFLKLIAATTTTALIPGCINIGGRYRINIDGSGTIYPLAMFIARRFHDEYENRAEISLGTSGTGGGFSKLAEGETHFNNASRPITESEIQKCKQNNIEYEEFELTYDGIVVVVNKNADWIDDITTEQLRQIWRPDNYAEKWIDINPNWPDKKFELYGPTSASGTFDYFTKEIVGETGASRRYTGFENHNYNITAVRQQKYSMAYFGYRYYHNNKEHLKALAIDHGEGPIKPNFETIRTEKYQPLRRPVYTYANTESLKKKHIRDFLKYYIESSASQDIQQIGYVPGGDELKQKNLEKLNQILDEIGVEEHTDR
ncbi:ABC-type phosphate transport system periplasmic component [Methanonatronarchaeum thermophilum]|uniref:ABC-type phosphate transport system periplasmic component n=1 Tax=Methanonatronarchaeum thermophilum TaxID=1927129 RepID=A0A1Y3GC43_9EURY|nr:substrate-binding domain-containing protein [Methanonatronarchaeum thermophilum]OUJ18998.1 ABC-type phosphate transport system periplasmic component [Methanonatronarchaeum thermophilum]